MRKILRKISDAVAERYVQQSFLDKYKLDVGKSNLPEDEKNRLLGNLYSDQRHVTGRKAFHDVAAVSMITAPLTIPPLAILSVFGLMYWGFTECGYKLSGGEYEKVRNSAKNKLRFSLNQIDEIRREGAD